MNLLFHLSSAIVFAFLFYLLVKKNNKIYILKKMLASESSGLINSNNFFKIICDIYGANYENENSINIPIKVNYREWRNFLTFAIITKVAIRPFEQSFFVIITFKNQRDTDFIEGVSNFILDKEKLASSIWPGIRLELINVD